MPIKTNGYTQNKKNKKHIKRQYAADDRQMKYDSLTKNEKLAIIKSRRGNSKKELAKVSNLK